MRSSWASSSWAAGARTNASAKRRAHHRDMKPPTARASFSTTSRRVPAQPVREGRLELLRLLDEEEVAAVLEKHRLGAGDPLGHPARCGERTDGILLAGEDQRRAGDAVQLVERVVLQAGVVLADVAGGEARLAADQPLDLGDAVTLRIEELGGDEVLHGVARVIGPTTAPLQDLAHVGEDTHAQRVELGERRAEDERLHPLRRAQRDVL